MKENGKMIWRLAKVKGIVNIGKITYANGDVYEGDLINGIKNGDGISKLNIGEFISHDDNDKYEGQWNNDKRNGEGIMSINY